MPPGRILRNAQIIFLELHNANRKCYNVNHKCLHKKDAKS